MKSLKDRRAAARYHSDMPTKTDQSAVANTDLNIIITHFLKTGQAPNAKPGAYGDFSELPDNLRDAIHATRELGQVRDRLPVQLRQMPLHELLALSAQDIARILTPVSTPAGKPNEEQAK